MRIKLLLLLAFLTPSFAQAAVNCADANVAVDAFGTPADPMTINYTRPSGSDFLGLVLAGYRLGGGALTISSMSFGAGTPTSLTTAQYTDPVGGNLYSLVAPPSGTSAVDTAFSGGRLTDGVVVFSCTGVNQASPTHDPNQSGGIGTTASLTISNVVATDVVVFCVVKDNSEAMTGGGSAVLIGTDTAAGEIGVGCWYQPGSAGGSTSVTWTGSQQWVMFGAAVQEATTTDTSGGTLWFQ